MSSTKLRKTPISSQISFYKEQIKNIDDRIEKMKVQKKVYQNLIRKLQRPDAEQKQQKRIEQYNLTQQKKQREQEKIARNRARIEREIEQCLRLNGKIV